uniref:RNA-dependent RNA polymerase n=1 Tax=Quercus lobata TaxID=97700 RepID=A0A7N2L809_QUELO
MERDIVPKPRTFLHSMENIKLHLGCQISNEKFVILWNAVNVSVNFGIGLRKLQFFLSHNYVEYRLDLYYENIWQIELRHPRSQDTKHLLIQLFGAPRIYEKAMLTSGSEFEDPNLNYFMHIPDDQWIRETDFTPSCYIGQSSALCLELPSDHQLPNFRENFGYYKESEERYILETGSSFSSNMDLVPIVGPPPGITLPFDILFKINSLVQHGCLAGPTLDAKCCQEPSRWLSEQYRKYITSRHPKSPVISLDSGLVYVRRVQITPSKVYFCGPEINVSNRVLRNFHEDIDNFLRVSFVDEELDKLHSTDLSPRASSGNEDRRTGIYKRILSILRNGIVIGDKKFEFLAFSSSQLRENSMWMFASINGRNADDIREWMGIFHQIRNVAKYAARLGQSFGSSTETLSVEKHEIEIIPDVEVVQDRVKYVFSDGIGKISSEFAKEVALKCSCKGHTPSAYQIRYGGYKGVVAVDPTSSAKLSLRKSMSKYESENTKLDVLAYTKFQPCYLNRQLITLLSTLGVEDYVFEKKQKEAVDQLDAILIDPLRAQEALDLMSPGENTNVLKEILKCGYRPDSEPFLSMMLQTFRASKLLELRTKTRIFIPDGRAMMGCLDETRTLEYGEVFVQFSSNKLRQLYNDFSMCSGSGSDQRFVLEGKIVVAKNPCLHPGDVRVLKAVNVLALHHMVNCVVFPQKGFRPHPNECSGSDLDGDIYFVCWDPELLPPRQIQPMDYSPAQSLQLDHDVTIEVLLMFFRQALVFLFCPNIKEVQEYFTNYIVNDSIGIISNAHTAFADKEPTKAMSNSCIELAKLFSIAVDFPKTGVPAVIPHELHVKDYPDFMEKPDKPTYISENVIGKLFREVKDITPNTSYFKSFTAEVAMQSYDSDMEVDGFEDFIDDAVYYKGNYDYKLGNMMDYYGIKTEAEILSGNIMRMGKSFTKRRDAEAITMAVKSLRKEARAWFNEKGSDLDSEAEDVYAKASAWYHVTYHYSYWGTYNEGMNRDHFLSFPWCVYDKLVHIKKEKARKRMALSSLEHQFSRGLRLS